VLIPVERQVQNFKDVSHFALSSSAKDADLSLKKYNLPQNKTFNYLHL
jgi:hypothetical protein